MPTFDEYMNAARNAHAAGDTTAAERLVKLAQDAEAAPRPQSAQPPQPGIVEQTARNFAQAGHGINTALAGLVSLPQESVAAAMRAVGFPASPAGTYFRTYQGAIPGAVEAGAKALGIPYRDVGAPANLQETVNRGFGEAAGNVGTTVGIGMGIAGVAARAGRPIAEAVGRAIAGQPATQLAAEATGRAVEGATDNGVAGTAASIAVPVAGAMLRRGISPVTNVRNVEERRLAGLLRNEGVPITAGQETGSRALQSAEATLATLPGSGAMSAAAQRNQWSKFTEAALKRAGIQSALATPEVIDNQFRDLGAKFGQLAAKTDVPIDANFRIETQRIRNYYGRALPSQQREVLDNFINDLTTLNGMRVVSIRGPLYQDTRTRLNGLIDQYRPTATKSGDATLTQSLIALRNALDGAMERHAAPDLRDQWRTARQQWANLETVADAVGGGAAEKGAQGYISPAQLVAATRRSRGVDRYARGFGDLNDLARAGSIFVKDTIPNSGTPERQFWQRAFTGAGPAMGAGAAGYLSRGNPMAMAAGAAAPFVVPPVAYGGMQALDSMGYLRNQIARGAQPQLTPGLLGALTLSELQSKFPGVLNQ